MKLDYIYCDLKKVLKQGNENGVKLKVASTT